MCGYVACVTEPQKSITQASRPHIVWYTTHSICISGNIEWFKKLPDDGRLLPKHVGVSI
jgi:hypothetical protein